MRGSTAPELASGLAGRFATGLAALARESLPPAVAHAAKRALLDLLARAVGASRHAGVDAIVATAHEIGDAPDAPVLGRSDRVDPLFAALAAGFAAHVDARRGPQGGAHPDPAACLGVLVGLAGDARDGPDAIDCERALRAFALGCEAQLRAALAISPEHGDRGWDVNGTCAGIGAAVTAAALSGFDEARNARAIGLAAAMPLGHGAASGTMARAFHPGKAAANGVLVARLFAGIDVPPDILESERGWAAALSSRFNLNAMVDGLEERWQFAQDGILRPLDDDELTERWATRVDSVLGAPDARTLRELTLEMPASEPLHTLFAAAVPDAPHRDAPRAPRSAEGASEAQVHGVSRGLAAFAVADHDGPEFEAACDVADGRFQAAQEVLPDAMGEAPLLRAMAIALTLVHPPEAAPIPDPVVVAATLAAGEIVHADDERVADAIAVGREVAARLAAALTFDAAWEIETVTAGIAATMAAAHAAGLDAAQAGNALGLAATQAAGLGALAGAPAEDFLRAKSAADAVEAAFLARHGFTAATCALEGGRGLARLLGSRLDEDALIADLGARWISAP